MTSVFGPFARMHIAGLKKPTALMPLPSQSRPNARLALKYFWLSIVILQVSFSRVRCFYQVYTLIAAIGVAARGGHRYFSLTVLPTHKMVWFRSVALRRFAGKWTHRRSAHSNQMRTFRFEYPAT